jgi:hypothetical protein
MVYPGIDWTRGRALLAGRGMEFLGNTMLLFGPNLGMVLCIAACLLLVWTRVSRGGSIWSACRWVVQSVDAWARRYTRFAKRCPSFLMNVIFFLCPFYYVINCPDFLFVNGMVKICGGVRARMTDRLKQTHAPLNAIVVQKAAGAIALFGLAAASSHTYLCSKQIFIKSTIMNKTKRFYEAFSGMVKRAGAAKCAYGPIIAIFATSIVVSMIAQCAHFICATRYGELYNDKLMQYVECLFRILLCAPYFIKVYYYVTDKTTVYQQNYLAKLFYALIKFVQSIITLCMYSYLSNMMDESEYSFGVLEYFCNTVPWKFSNYLFVPSTGITLSLLIIQIAPCNKKLLYNNPSNVSKCCQGKKFQKIKKVMPKNIMYPSNIKLLKYVFNRDIKNVKTSSGQTILNPLRSFSEELKKFEIEFEIKVLGSHHKMDMKSFNKSFNKFLLYCKDKFRSVHPKLPKEEVSLPNKAKKSSEYTKKYSNSFISEYKWHIFFALIITYMTAAEAAVPANMPQLSHITRPFGEQRFSGEGANRWSEWNTFTGKLFAVLNNITPAFKILLSELSEFPEDGVNTSKELWQQALSAAGVTDAKMVVMSLFLYTALLFLCEGTANDIVTNTTGPDTKKGRKAFLNLRKHLTRGDHGQKSVLTNQINNFSMTSGQDPTPHIIALNGKFREIAAMGSTAFQSQFDKITVLFNGAPSEFVSVITVFETSAKN